MGDILGRRTKTRNFIPGPPSRPFWAVPPLSWRGRSGKSCELNSRDRVECREALASADIAPFLQRAGWGPNPPCIPAPGTGRVLGEAREVFAQLME